MSGGHIRKRNGRWQARYRVPGGGERTKTFDRKIDAHRWLSVEAGSVAEGRWIDPRDGRTTVAEYAGSWLESRPIKPQTRVGYDRVLRLHILPTFGDRPMSNIRKSEVEGWITRLGESYAVSTCDTVFRIIGALFNSAVEDRLISVSPTRGVKGPRAPKKIIVPLTGDEIEALIDAASDRYKALVAFAAGSGLRQGEVFGVTTSSLDMLRRQVRVERQLVQIDDGPPDWGTLKTPASIRTVPLADVTLEALAWHLGRFEPGRDGAIFTNKNGDWHRRVSFGMAWKKIVERSGIQRDGRLGFHQLRHFYASALIAAGEQPKVVQTRMGHASLTMTLETYSHLMPTDDETTRSAIERALDTSRGESPAVSSRSGGQKGTRNPWSED